LIVRKTKNHEVRQAGAEPKLQEASRAPEAAAKAEAKKERTPRLDWAGLLRIRQQQDTTRYPKRQAICARTYVSPDSGPVLDNNWISP
jgi:hypothetical protein